MPRPFILAPHRRQPAKPTPPSPYSIVLRPTGPGAPSALVAARIIECPRKVQNLEGASRFARGFAADVGLAGTIHVRERDGETWRTLRIATVKNSAVTGWRDA